MTGIATQKELTAAKKYIQSAFFEMCGFAPQMKDINVIDLLYLEEGEPEFVQFSVNDHIYQYDGETVEHL